jgi:hypothetical protein
MKKNITILSAVVLLTGSAILTSCKKDDVTAPVVTLTGGDMTISLQGTFSDPGASANDNKDGSISPSVSGVVDVNRTGVYALVYSATDAAGNEGTATRNVTVVNDLDAMTGVYTCSITGVASYTQTVTASSTVNRRILFSQFAKYTDNTPINNPVYADVVGNTLNIPSQTRFNVGTPPGNADRTFSGSGTKASSGSSVGISLNYIENTNGFPPSNTVENMIKN